MLHVLNGQPGFAAREDRPRDAAGRKVGLRAARPRVPCGGRPGGGLPWNREALTPACFGSWRPRFTCCTHSAKKATERSGHQWKPPHCTLATPQECCGLRSLSCTSIDSSVLGWIDPVCCADALSRARLLFLTFFFLSLCQRNPWISISIPISTPTLIPIHGLPWAESRSSSSDCPP